MSLYADLSTYYDEIFATSPSEMLYTTLLLHDKKRILDLGCGSGNKTVHFANRETQITAVDNDPAMIAIANGTNARSNIEYRVLDMQSIAKTFPPSTFDAVVCLGNTLVHLTTPDAIQATLHDLNTVMQPGATLIIQILNYDRIPQNEPFDLPSIQTPKATFTRRYEWKDGVMHFCTALTIKATQVTHTDNTILYPLRQEPFTKMLEDTGFSQTRIYGSYFKEAWQEDSFLTFAVSTKE